MTRDTTADGSRYERNAQAGGQRERKSDQLDERKLLKDRGRKSAQHGNN